MLPKHVHKAGILALLALLMIVLVAPTLAQSNPTIIDETESLDRAAVRRAAQPLVDRGARVGVFLVQRGGENDALRRYQRAGLASGSAINADTIAIYVSFNPRYSEIAYGDRWNAALRTNDNAETIRQNQLNPGLASGNATRGVVDALTAIERSIASPPVPAGGTTININPVPIVAGVIFLVLLAVAGPTLWSGFQRRRAAAKALEAARAATEEARRLASSAIVDLSQALRSAQEKAKFDRVSYAEADVRQLAAMQSDVEQRFARVQERFAETEKSLVLRKTLVQADYEAAAQQYRQIAQEATAIRERLAQVEARRAELDRIAQAAPGEVDKAKKALADVAAQLSALSADLQPEAALQSAESLVERAEQLLQERRAADAIAAAEAASAAITALAGTIARMRDIQDGIAAGRAAAERAAAQGFRVDAGLASFNTAEGLLRQAAAALPVVGPEGVASLLDQADKARELGVIRGGGLPARYRANLERLEKVRAAGEALASFIDEGWRVFDLVDEFAESTWSDIRGNGSEAERAADEAQALWERAAERNSMERQEFIEASADLDQAEERIAYARALIEAIIKRLKDLEAARDAARDEIAAAEADIMQGRAFIAANDPDVGKEPEKLLARAESALAQARAEMQLERPDWLQIIRLAHEANHLADEALRGARSEVEAMNRLREQLKRMQQVATAEVQKIVQFMTVHPRDLPVGAKDKINGLQINLQAAYTAAQGAEQKEEEARAEALRDAIERYTALEQQAAGIYAEIENHYRRIEALRRQVRTEANRARSAITRAEKLSAQVGGLSAVSLIQEARASYNQIGEVHSEADARRALERARDAYDKAERASRILEQQFTDQGSQDSLGDFIGGVLVGMLLDGHDSDDSWSGSSGRRSSGSWSGGSRSGSDWGGGGRSGGSWGSGGSSGGGWGGGGRSGGGW
ncbi:MAG: chromosome partitioning protein ParA [Roseiflexus sp.]|nr:chromosome partitioning protein ParA [Roseiflexus sp.]